LNVAIQLGDLDRPYLRLRLRDDRSLLTEQRLQEIDEHGSRMFGRLPLHRPNGANGMSDIEGKVTRVGASERVQRTSFKIICRNFVNGYFLRPRGVRPQSEISNQISNLSASRLKVGRKSSRIMTIGRMLQQRALHPRSDEVRPNHQNPEAPIGFACLSETQL